MSYAKRVLRINLTSRKIVSLPLPEPLVRDYLGGRGMAVKMLYELLPKGVEAFSPENLLIFATGPLSGTLAPAAASLSVVSRSPLTGLLAVETEAGTFASELKFAGYDMIVIEGKANELVYLEIDDDRAELKPAAELKGRTTSETADLLHEKLGDDYKIASIGLAGENRVLYASIMCDGIDHIARTGLGAVMGSKNLKAIAVHGTRDVSLFNTDRFLQKMRDTHTHLKNDVMFNSMSRYGTTELVNKAHENGALSIRNGQDGVFNRMLGISRNTMDQVANSAGRRLVQRPCSACIMPCKAFIQTNRPERYVRPDYQAVASLGPRLAISKSDVIIEAVHRCEEYGIDPLSFGGSLAFLTECFQRRLFTDAELKWGKEDLLLDLIRFTAEKIGTGELLAMGVRNMSRRFNGSADFAMHVKGLELPAIEGRAAKAHALAMAIGNRGGDTALHMPQFELLTKSEQEAEEEFIFASTAHPLEWQGKASMVIWHEYFGAVLDSASICKHYAFTAYALKPSDIADLLTFAIGTRYSEMEVMLIGERISTVERLFNLRHGMNPTNDDTLPRRLTTEKLTEGKAAGQVVELGNMLQEYYMLRGLTDDGKPRMDNLQSLGIIGEGVASRR
jgi:aldehyde:ferredoxin oxidoreductase